MKIKRPTLTGPVSYLGHFAKPKHLAAGHNTDGKYARAKEYNAKEARSDSDPGARGQELKFMYPPRGTTDMMNIEIPPRNDESMAKKAPAHPGEMNHPRNSERRKRKTAM